VVVVVLLLLQLLLLLAWVVEEEEGAAVTMKRHVHDRHGSHHQARRRPDYVSSMLPGARGQ
jgi:hypothetical protein